jgi:hypothetical protein
MTHVPNNSHRRHVPKTTVPTRLTSAMVSVERRVVTTNKTS